MQNLLFSFLIDLGLTVVLFIICSLIVVGAKTFYVYFLSLAHKNKNAKLQEKPKAKKSSPPKKAPKSIKSIEIDPNDFDKIYFKKSS